MTFSQPQGFLWIDMETTGLFEAPDGSFDPHLDRILEVAVIATDFDLTPAAGYTEVIKLDKAGADRLRENEYVRNMHRENGLIKEAAASTKTLAEVEQEIIDTLTEDTPWSEGEFMLAGSGNAAFDFTLIKFHMPKLRSWLAYYPADIGIYRRMTRILSGGRKFINDSHSASFGAAKLHRAYADAEAHLAEAKSYSDWLKAL